MDRQQNNQTQTRDVLAKHVAQNYNNTALSSLFLTTSSFVMEKFRSAPSAPKRTNSIPSNTSSFSNPTREGFADSYTFSTSLQDEHQQQHRTQNHDHLTNNWMGAVATKIAHHQNHQQQGHVERRKSAHILRTHTNAQNPAVRSPVFQSSSRVVSENFADFPHLMDMQQDLKTPPLPQNHDLDQQSRQDADDFVDDNHATEDHTTNDTNDTNLDNNTTNDTADHNDDNNSDDNNNDNNNNDDNNNDDNNNVDNDNENDNNSTENDSTTTSEEADQNNTTTTNNNTNTNNNQTIGGAVPSRALQRLMQVAWSTLALPGTRRVMPLLFPSSICYIDSSTHPNVRGVVALTIDDAPCRQPPKYNTAQNTFEDACLVKDVVALMEKHGAHATFFITSSFVEGHEDDVRFLCENGNELANHCPEDKPYHRLSEDQFRDALEETDQVIRQFQPEGSRLFRAPCGMLSKAMQHVLTEKGMANVMVDCYANDCAVSDSEWISTFILSRVKEGSIVLLHMPERGFREWNLSSLSQTLDGLTAMGLKCVTVSRLLSLAHETQHHEEEQHKVNAGDGGKPESDVVVANDQAGDETASDAESDKSGGTHNNVSDDNTNDQQNNASHDNSKSDNENDVADTQKTDANGSPNNNDIGNEGRVSPRIEAIQPADNSTNKAGENEASVPTLDLTFGAIDAVEESCVVQPQALVDTDDFQHTNEFDHTAKDNSTDHNISHNSSSNNDHQADEALQSTMIETSRVSVGSVPSFTLNIREGDTAAVKHHLKLGSQRHSQATTFTEESMSESDWNVGCAESAQLARFAFSPPSPAPQTPIASCSPPTPMLYAETPPALPAAFSSTQQTPDTSQTPHTPHVQTTSPTAVDTPTPVSPASFLLESTATPPPVRISNTETTPTPHQPHDEDADELDDTAHHSDQAHSTTPTSPTENRDRGTKQHSKNTTKQSRKQRQKQRRRQK